MTSRKTESLTARATTLAREHLALTISTGLVVVSVLHIAVVAKFDPQTVRTLLTVADRTQILLSTVTIVFVTTSAAAVVVFWRPAIRLYVKAVDQSFPKQFLAVFAGSLLVYGLARLPVMFWIAITCSGLYVFFAKRRAKKAGTLRDDGRIEVSAEAGSWSTLSIAIVLSTLVVVYLGEPWVAEENIKLTKNEAVTGFVMGSEGPFTVLMVDDEVRWVRTSSIVEREVCDNGDDDWLSKRIRFGVTYPKCDN